MPVIGYIHSCGGMLRGTRHSSLPLHTPNSLITLPDKYNRNQHRSILCPVLQSHHADISKTVDQKIQAHRLGLYVWITRLMNAPGLEQGSERRQSRITFSSSYDHAPFCHNLPVPNRKVIQYRERVEKFIVVSIIWITTKFVPAVC